MSLRAADVSFGLSGKFSGILRVWEKRYLLWDFWWKLPRYLKHGWSVATEGSSSALWQCRYHKSRRGKRHFRVCRTGKRNILLQLYLQFLHTSAHIPSTTSLSNIPVESLESFSGNWCGVKVTREEEKWLTRTRYWIFFVRTILPSGTSFRTLLPYSLPLAPRISWCRIVWAFCIKQYTIIELVQLLGNASLSLTRQFAQIHKCFLSSTTAIRYPFPARTKIIHPPPSCASRNKRERLIKVFIGIFCHTNNFHGSVRISAGATLAHDGGSGDEWQWGPVHRDHGVRATEDGRRNWLFYCLQVSSLSVIIGLTGLAFAHQPWEFFVGNRLHYWA